MVESRSSQGLPLIRLGGTSVREAVKSQFLLPGITKSVQEPNFAPTPIWYNLLNHWSVQEKTPSMSIRSSKLPLLPPSETIVPVTVEAVPPPPPPSMLWPLLVVIFNLSTKLP